jgi:pilus assembly protein CpaB
MGFLRNKIFILAICSITVFCIIFIGIPRYTEKTKETIKVVRVSDDVPKDTLIQQNMLTVTEIGGFNVPKDVITDPKAIVGKYSSVDLLKTDNLVASKFKDDKSMPDQFLYNMNGKTAISVSVKTLAAGLSGKLMPGDVVSILVYSKDTQEYSEGQGYIPSKGKVMDYPNLEFLEVGAVTNSKAQDTDQVMKNQDKANSSSSTDTIIPTTVTLLASKEQARELVDAENSGNIHVVFRGRDREAEKLLELNKGQNENKSAAAEKKAATSEKSTAPAQPIQQNMKANVQKNNQNTSKDTSQFNMK